MDESPKSDLLRRLIAQAGDVKRFQVWYRFPGEAKWALPPSDLLTALGIEKEDLSNVALATLEAIEELTKTADADWIDFQWKLTAFTYIQDIFDACIQPSDDMRVWFQQYYFYYESRILLAESVLAGLNGLYVASGSLLRPFLEFSLLQNYYYRVTRSAGSYAPVEQYFANRHHPSWNTILRKALPDDGFSRTVRFRLQAHLAGLSESAVHSYHPDHSPVQHRPTEHGHSLEGLFFWQTARLVLEAVLWTYYVNFPLLFHPIDLLHKFGYNGPAGLVVDRYATEAVRRSLTPDDFQAFLEYSLTQDATRDTLEWIETLPDLTDEQIRSTWRESEDGPLTDLWIGYGLRVAKFRALRVGMAFRRREERSVPDAYMNDIRTLSGWKRISRHNRTQGR
jgi:hypothetical protein